jgi:hypothetical protein
MPAVHAVAANQLARESNLRTKLLFRPAEVGVPWLKLGHADLDNEC